MSVLTDSDYEDLKPHLQVIRHQRDSGGHELSQAPRQLMARIIRERYGEEMNLSCGGCIGRMYNLINSFIDQYEHHRNS